MQTQNTLQPVPVAQVCGIMISIWQSIQLADLLNAAVCAATGTVVSFLVTAWLKHLFKVKSKK